jgi:hypothetical protein
MDIAISSGCDRYIDRLHTNERITCPFSVMYDGLLLAKMGDRDKDEVEPFSAGAWLFRVQLDALDLIMTSCSRGREQNALNRYR